MSLFYIRQKFNQNMQYLRFFVLLQFVRSMNLPSSYQPIMLSNHEEGDGFHFDGSQICEPLIYFFELQRYFYREKNGSQFLTPTKDGPAKTVVHDAESSYECIFYPENCDNSVLKLRLDWYYKFDKWFSLLSSNLFFLLLHIMWTKQINC